MNLIFLPALLFFGWGNFAMMIPKKDSRQLVRPCRTQKNNKEGFTLQHPHFIDADGSFTLDRPEEISQLYFPLASEAGLKSCVSPDLGGDAKLDQETFLLEPVSVENLHNNRSTRNFWLVGADGTAFSLTGASEAQQAVKFTPAQEDSRLTAGFM